MVSQSAWSACSARCVGGHAPSRHADITARPPAQQVTFRIVRSATPHPAVPPRMPTPQPDRRLLWREFDIPADLEPTAEAELHCTSGPAGLPRARKGRSFGANCPRTPGITCDGMSAAAPGPPVPRRNPSPQACSKTAPHRLQPLTSGRRAPSQGVSASGPRFGDIHVTTVAGAMRRVDTQARQSVAPDLRCGC